MEKTFAGDDPSLAPSERLAIHRQGIRAIRAYNEGVMHAQGEDAQVYKASTIDAMLNSMLVIADNASEIEKERDHFKECLDISVKALAEAVEEVNKLRAELGMEHN